MPVIARGDLAATDAAVFAAAACSAAVSENTSVTSPMSFASCGLKTRAVNASSLALPEQANKKEDVRPWEERRLQDSGVHSKSCLNRGVSYSYRHSDDMQSPALLLREQAYWSQPEPGARSPEGEIDLLPAEQA